MQYFCAVVIFFYYLRAVSYYTIVGLMENPRDTY